MNSLKVAVIGGGAAGLVAAGRCAETGTKTLLLEKNKYLGRKIGITGKGRCNLTTSIASIEDIIAQYPGNGRFLYSVFSQFSNLDTIDFFNSLGLKTGTERGQRVFPASDKARDVVKALEKYVKSSGCEIKTETPVSGISRLPGSGFKVTTIKSTVEVERVILAVGGASYPGTGSTGDGYSWAMELGHTVIPIQPALVPLESSDPWVKDLQGLSLRNVRVWLSDSDHILGSEFGEMLFTHFGVSGPVILTLSRTAAGELGKGRQPLIHIDLKPALKPETLDQRIQRDFKKYQRKFVQNAMVDLLPQALIPVVLGHVAVDSEKPTHSITRQERQRLVETLKDLTLTVSGTRPLSEAIVTAGGVATNEINPRTMESKIIPGLYFAGEIMDIDGNTGGFNLQAAFSTGYVAGANAADK